MKLSLLQEFDAAEAIRDAEALAAYLQLAFDSGSSCQIRRALSVGARARGLMSLEEVLRNDEPLTMRLTLLALKQLGMRLVPTSTALSAPEAASVK